jgi:peroxiredoxin
VAELRPHVDTIRALGAELFVIGTGGPHFAKAFQEDLGIPSTPVLSDETRAAYLAAGFERSVAGILSPSMVKAGIRALRGGHRQKATMGDGLQLGGTMIVRPSGEVPYFFAGHFAGDHARPEEILAALRTPR